MKYILLNVYFFYSTYFLGTIIKSNHSLCVCVCVLGTLTTELKQQTLPLVLNTSKGLLAVSKGPETTNQIQLWSIKESRCQAWGGGG